jgi:hypothetical protein
VLQKHVVDTAKSQLFKLGNNSPSIDLTLPGHKYFGPGSVIGVETTDAPPTNERDEIAYAHDWQYAPAIHKEDIIEADYKAIEEFGKLWDEKQDLIAKFSALSLSAKVLVESIFGFTIYPYNL